MNTLEFLFLCEIFGLLGEFEGSFSTHRLLDAFVKGVFTKTNFEPFMAAFKGLGAGENFHEFLEQTFMTFLQHTFMILPVRFIQIQMVSRRVSVVFFKNNLDKMRMHPDEHTVAFLKRISHPAILKGKIPADARLSDGYRLTHVVRSSIPDSLWGDMCPRCGYVCGNGDHMNPNWGQFPNLGRYMFENIISESAREFFYMFCAEYARFYTSVLHFPLILSDVCVGSLSQREDGLKIPVLPSFFKGIHFMQSILGEFKEIEIYENKTTLVPLSFVPLLDKKPNRIDLLGRGAIPRKIVHSLNLGSSIGSSIMRRVLHASNMQRLDAFKAPNSVFCGKILRVLRSDLEQSELLKALIAAFDKLSQI